MSVVHQPANTVDQPADAGSSSKAPQNELVLIGSVPSVQTRNDLAIAACNGPLRVGFVVQYTELGFEAFYAELAALQTEVERTRHIKRCLIDIVRGDFKRPSSRPFYLGEHNQESFKVEIRLSTRDVGLEAVYDELRALPSTFSRTYALRRKLFDAFQAQPQATQPTARPDLHRLADYSATVPAPPIKPASAPALTNPSTLDHLSKRRQEARQSIATAFEFL
jgi:hypothetical protein